MSSNLFSESLKVILESANCLSRLSMVSSLDDTCNIMMRDDTDNDIMDGWVVTPFSSSILFLTLWSALMQAPANSRVAWAQMLRGSTDFTWEQRFHLGAQVTSTSTNYYQRNESRANMSIWKFAVSPLQVGLLVSRCSPEVESTGIWKQLGPL